MTNNPTRYRVRDDHLPDRPPLALADTYPDAMAALQLLHQQFRDQIAASGEGGAKALQRLAIDELTRHGDTICRHLSSISGQ